MHSTRMSLFSIGNNFYFYSPAKSVFKSLSDGLGEHQRKSDDFKLMLSRIDGLNHIIGNRISQLSLFQQLQTSVVIILVWVFFPID